MAGFLPVLRRLDIAVPKRPSSALTRTDWVNGAASRLIVKNAIAVGLFAKALALTEPARIELFDLLARLVTKRGKRAQLVVVDPNNTGRPRAAISALVKKWKEVTAMMDLI